jgi:Escherichia/Staphylococcus phage prohead protease
MSNQREIRFANLELRADGAGKQPRITGMAARFRAKTTIQRGLNEVIAPGAFKRSIANGDDVVLNFNHSDDKVCARVSAGTLTLRESDEGLMFDAEVDPEVSYVNDLYRSIKAGNISECSFSFTPYEDGDVIEPDPNESGAYLRTLKSVRLWDVAAVTHPAYGGNVTNVNARNIVADHVEARMVAVTQAAATESRRQRAAALLAEIHEENQKLSAQDQLAIDMQLRSRFEVLKLL